MPGLLDTLTDVEHAETVTGLPLVSGRFPAGEHDRVWRALRDEHGRTGRWPVLGWTAAEAAELSSEYRRWNGGPQGTALLDSLRDTDPAGRVADIVQAVREDFLDGVDPGEPSGAEAFAEFDAAAVAAAAARLPEGPHRRLPKTTNYPPTDVLLVPATAAYEVLAHVPWILPVMNNWSGGPTHPDLLYADHLLTLRHWEQRWGAQLYYCGGPHLELSVARPPRDPLSAAACATEQAAYCYDLAQTLGDNAMVARHQASGTHWSFWWD